MLLTLSLVTLATLMLVSLGISLTQALCARRWGIAVKEVAVGVGPRLFRISGSQWTWSVRLSLVCGFTRFVSKEELEEGVLRGWRRGPQHAWEDAPGKVRVIVALSGVAWLLMMGVVLMTAPLLTGAGQVVLSASEHVQIDPNAVGGLGVAQEPIGLPGQAQLIVDVGVQAFQKYFLFQPIEEWGGPIGAIPTCGAAGRVGGFACWATCLGAILILWGVILLLPLPGRPTFECAVGAERWLRGGKSLLYASPIYALGYLFEVCVLLRALHADIIWLGG